MDETKLITLLEPLDLGEIKYFDSIDSTNLFAGNLLQKGTPNNSLIVANQQSKGKGRLDRTWSTPKDSALAFSLILHPITPSIYPLLPGIIGVSIAQAIESKFEVCVKLKWPNDILLNQKKVAGILVESIWNGNTLIGSIIGVGINIATESVPISNNLRFPAGCLNEEIGQYIDRWEFLKEILEMILRNISNPSIPMHISEWDDRIAYKNKEVRLFSLNRPVSEGLLLGISENGGIRILIEGEGVKVFSSGEISLRPK